MRLALAFALVAVASHAQDIVPWIERKAPRPDLLKKVAFDQKLNAQVPLDVPFRDEAGRAVALATYFRNKPVVLTLAYYECPMLCTLALNGELRAFRALGFTAGNEFEAVVISINPKEGPVLAAAKKANYLEKYRRRGADWHFLTGTEPAIRAVADAVGFRYEYDPESRQYAHAAGIVVLTPEGRVARYQYGVEYSAEDLRLALLDASSNRIGRPVDKILLYCFHYDPATGKYSLAILNLVRAGAVATFIGVFALIVAAQRRRRARGARA
ncbi:MAG: SCO family protein [Acidobacteriota bacterium]